NSSSAASFAAKPRIPRVYRLRGDASDADGFVLRPVAGALAPASVTGLSKSHIRPSPTVTFYVGGSLMRFDSLESGSRAAQAKLVRRTARRYMQAMNRVRRIGRLERLLPRQMCAGFMLNGELSRFRKRCPEAKISQQ